ncbi:hypothetical protein GCM10027072_75830 [Streptomyces bullii]
MFDRLRNKFGTVLVIVDQPASIGALPLTVARNTGCLIAYLPGLAMRRIADLYPGEAKPRTRQSLLDTGASMPYVRPPGCGCSCARRRRGGARRSAVLPVVSCERRAPVHTRASQRSLRV